MTTFNLDDGTVLDDGHILGPWPHPAPPRPAPPIPPLQTIIPCYVYEQYSDDINVVAFFEAVNALAQPYLDWFNSTPLSVYTSPNISGLLLDWVGEGIYGITRPVFSSIVTAFLAGTNALPTDATFTNGYEFFRSGTATPADDDFYKRVLTWVNYLGDGRSFNVQFLRWRVARFIYGSSGTNATMAQAQTIHIQPGMVPPPAAPGLSGVAGGALSSRTYAARLTFVTPIGETLAGPVTQATIAASNLAQIPSPARTNGAESYNAYLAQINASPTFQGGTNALAANWYGTNSGNNYAPSPMTKQNTVPIAIGVAWTEPISGLISDGLLPTADTSNSPTNYIISVPTSQAATFMAEALNQGILPVPQQLTAEVVMT